MRRFEKIFSFFYVILLVFISVALQKKKKGVPILSVHLYFSYLILKRLGFKINYFLGFLIAACAAASLAIGTLNGEQDT